MKRFTVVPALSVLMLVLAAYFGYDRPAFGQQDEEPALSKGNLPFSQVVKAGGFIFVSGQISMDPVTGKVVEGDITVQTRQVIKNIETELKKAGAGLEDVVKTSVFLKTMDDFREMNKVYVEFFSKAKPTRATVAVSGLALGLLVEIEAIALDPETKGEIKRM